MSLKVCPPISVSLTPLSLIHIRKLGLMPPPLPMEWVAWKQIPTCVVTPVLSARHGSTARHDSIAAPWHAEVEITSTCYRALPPGKRQRRKSWGWGWVGGDCEGKDFKEKEWWKITAWLQRKVAFWVSLNACLSSSSKNPVRNLPEIMLTSSERPPPKKCVRFAEKWQWDPAPASALTWVAAH